MEKSVRKIPLQHSQNTTQIRAVDVHHLPVKLNPSGVMPVIFASSFMTFPAMMIQIFAADKVGGTGFLAGLYKFSIATSSSYSCEICLPSSVTNSGFKDLYSI